MSKFNIKGRCRIELTDIKTGKKEIEEHDNMLTKALYYFYDQGGITNPSAFLASAIRTDALNQLLGGVMCLDTALTESDEIVRVPAGVGMTANGARNILNSGNPSELGSYNENESGWQQDGSFKMVWDWTQSQGNGDIKCVCLSSLYGGMKGIGNKSLTNKANSYNINNYNSLIGGFSGLSGVAFGYKDNVIYAIQSFTGQAKWTVKKYDAQYTTIDVRDSMTAREIDEIEISIPSAIQNLPASNGGSGEQAIYGNMQTFFQKGDHLYILLLCSEGSYVASYWKEYFSDSNPWYAIDYNLATGSVSAISLNPTNTGISALPGESGANYIAGITDKWAVIGNTAVEMTNLANSIDIANASAGTSDYNNRLLTGIDTDILDWSSSNGWRYDLVAEKALPTNGVGIGGMANMPSNPLLRRSGASIYRDSNYIATIFNLSSPVTKTADKTMKVTYILRFS